MKDDPRSRAGQQPVALPRPDSSLDASGADPTRPATESSSEDDSDDEFYDDEHFEPL